MLLLTLLNSDDPSKLKLQRNTTHLLTVEIMLSDGRCTVTQGPFRGIAVQNVDVHDLFDGEREFVFRLLHGGGYDEVWLNERRLVLLPSIEQPERVGFDMMVRGLKTKVQVAYSKVNAEAKN